MRSNHNFRKGFVMITMLWILTAASVVALAALLAGRDTIYAARNRVLLERAYWMAAACAARLHEKIDAQLAQARSFEEAAAVWRVLDRLVLPAPQHGCVVQLEAAGTRLDVNDASDVLLENLFRAMRYGDAARELADALLDWRDSDDVARPRGVERAWYGAASRALPRNAPFADLRELARARGFESRAFDSVLSAEPGRIAIAAAPVTVLLAVPGITPEAAERLVALRDEGTPAPDITAILGDISRASAESLLANYPAIARATTANPDAWILSVRATVGPPPNEALLTQRLVRSGRRAVVVQSRGVW